MVPSSKELTYFHTIAITENLSRAASQLGISQPALTLSMQRLEVTVGASLFIRHKKGVTLSQAGKHLLIHIKPLMHYWESAKSQTLTYHREVQGKFTIGCHSISITQINKILPHLLKTHPNLELNLHHDISKKICEKIIDLSIDIGIIARPIKHPDLIITKLYDNEFSFWSMNEAEIHKKLKTGNAVIVCDPNIAQSEILLKKLKRFKMSYSRLLTTNSLESAASLTACGCGIGILPSCYAMSMYPTTLCKIPNLPTHSDEICLVYRHENRNIPAIKIITAAIKNSLKMENSL